MIESEIYDNAVKHRIAHDFQKFSQDAIALWIIGRKGALPYIHSGNVAGATSLLNRRWPSLLGGRQQELSEQEAENYFWSQLGETPK